MSYNWPFLTVNESQVLAVVRGVPCLSLSHSLLNDRNIFEIIAWFSSCRWHLPFLFVPWEFKEWFGCYHYKMKFKLKIAHQPQLNPKWCFPFRALLPPSAPARGPKAAPCYAQVTYFYENEHFKGHHVLCLQCFNLMFFFSGKTTISQSTMNLNSSAQSTAKNSTRTAFKTPAPPARGRGTLAGLFESAEGDDVFVATL